MAEPLAFRYARALFEVVEERVSELTPETALAELEKFEIALAESAELRDVLLTPAVPGPRKKAVITQLAVHLEVSKWVRDFLYLVVRKRRIGLVKEMRRAFEDLIDQREGVVRADVASAQDLTESQRQAVSLGLNGLTGKRVKPRFSVDAGLLGGVVARIGSTVYDSSVRGRLAVLHRRLVTADPAAYEKG